MAEWGRKEYSKAWPSRRPVWTWGAIFLSLLFFAGMLTLEYEQSWTAAERLYLSDYLKSGARGHASATSGAEYTLLEAVVGKGQRRLVMGDEIEPVPDVNGTPGYRLTEEGVKDGVARLTWVRDIFNDRGLHRVMSEAVYAGHESWEFYQKPVYLSLAFLVLALFVAVPKDRARRMIWKHGRRLRGPELVTTAEFNTKLGRSKGLRVILPDGAAFINEEISWYDKTFHKTLSQWARIPRDREAMHFLIVGDSGTGKSAAIRQLLSQVWERGEAAIVYDPAMEYLPQFYNKARGDVILNPMDARCPFWSPGDEVPHEAEALTLAANLFPEPMSFSTQNARLIPLRMWFRWLTRRNHLLHNPALELELPRLGKPLPKNIFSAQEVEQIMQLCDVADPIGLRDRAILEVLYSTGIRRMEIIALKLYDLSLDRGVILVHGKGKKDRYVPIGERAIAWLQKYINEARPQLVSEPDDYTIFLTAQGELFNRDHMSWTVKGRIDAAKLGKTGACHLFRHTMAMLMHENGADIRFIQELLGHMRLQTTQIYTQVSIRTLQQVHAATHPAAMLGHSPAASRPVLGPAAEELFAALESEAEEDREAS